MALTPSTMQLSLGAEAPDFTLPDPDGKVHSLDDFAGRPPCWSPLSATIAPTSSTSRRHSPSLPRSIRSGA